MENSSFMQYAKKYKRPNRMILSWKTQAMICKGQKAPNELPRRRLIVRNTRLA